MATLGLLFLLLSYGGLVAFYLAPRQAIVNLDFWYHIGVGQQLAMRDPHTLVDGLYPLGYPFLLARGIQLGLDALRVGQFLAVLGGGCALSAMYLIVFRSTQSPGLSVASGLLLLTNGVFLTYATIEGNDMLAMGLQVLALAAVWAAITGTEGARSNWLLASGGLFLGLAYLVRYTTLLILPLLLVYVTWRYWRRPQSMLRKLAIMLAAFLAVTAIQWIPSLLLFGTPFYNTQPKNVWFGIYGQLDWVNNWNKAPDTISLLQVVLMDPLRFLQHWWTQIQQPFVTLRLWPPLLHIAWIVAIAWLLLDRSRPLLQRVYFPLVLFVTLGFTALAWLGARFLLTPLWVQCLLLVWLLVRLARFGGNRLRTSPTLLASGLFLGAIALQVPDVLDWWQTPLVTRPLTVNRILRLAGMVDPQEVAANDPIYHATDVPARTHYAQAYATVPDPHSVTDIFAHPAAQAWKFLVIDRAEGVTAYAALLDEFTAANTILAPLVMNDQFAIFCAMPCAFTGTERVDWRFGDGMHLRGYRLHQADRGGALYLDWQAEQALASSYKVSVRVIDPTGATVAQIDNIPQVWTRPTTTWPVGEPIVDFYSWELAESCGECRVALLVYDAETQTPLPVITGGGRPGGPLMELP